MNPIGELDARGHYRLYGYGITALPPAAQMNVQTTPGHWHPQPQIENGFCWVLHRESKMEIVARLSGGQCYIPGDTHPFKPETDHHRFLWSDPIHPPPFP